MGVFPMYESRASIITEEEEIRSTYTLKGGPGRTAREGGNSYML